MGLSADTSRGLVENFRRLLAQPCPKNGTTYVLSPERSPSRDRPLTHFLLEHQVAREDIAPPSWCHAPDSSEDAVPPLLPIASPSRVQHACGSSCRAATSIFCPRFFCLLLRSFARDVLQRRSPCSSPDRPLPPLLLECQFLGKMLCGLPSSCEQKIQPPSGIIRAASLQRANSALVGNR